MTGAEIAGLGMALPEAELTNAQLADQLGVTEEWIVSRTGIRSRRIASENETAATLGLRASLLALTDAGLDPADVDLIICATVTSEARFPSTACRIQSGLSANAPAFDINAGCSGFLFALAQADAAIRSDTARCVLVVGTEVLSRIVDGKDKRTAILFGDGAGAAVVKKSNERSIGPFRLFSDGSRPELLYVNPASDLIHMEGREVYRAAVDAMASSVADLVADRRIDPSDVDIVIAHQANQRILDAVAARLGLEPGVCFSNIADYGNTSAASIPIALFEAREQNRIQGGDTVILTAFGAGFAWGAGILRWVPSNLQDRPVAQAGARHV